MQKVSPRLVIWVCLLSLLTYWLPGLLLSALLISAFVFRNKTIAFLQRLYSWETANLESLWESKKTALKKITRRLVLVMLAVNVIGWVFGKNMGRNGEKPEPFPLLFHTATIQAETFSYAGNDNGTAQITVSVRPDEWKIFYAPFNYDLLYDASPVSVNYGFYNLDIFPDILLDSSNGDYIISGFSGEIYPHATILTSLFYR